jgi:type I restriction enzyme S subunit
MNVHFSGFREKGLVFLDDEQARQLDGVTVRTHDVLLNITGASIGRVTLAPERMNGARVNQHVAIIRLHDGVEPGFVAAYLASPEVQRHILEENYGVTRPALTKSMIEEMRLPVPPLAEQRRIVTKIDSLSAKSRRARDQLDHIPRLVEKYKQAILDMVFRRFRDRQKLVRLVVPDRGIPYGIVQTGKPTTGGIPTVRGGDIKRFRVSRSQLKTVDAAIESNFRRTRLQGGKS